MDNYERIKFSFWGYFKILGWWACMECPKIDPSIIRYYLLKKACH